MWPSSGFLPDALISLDRNCPPVRLPAREAHGKQNLDSAEWQLVTANDRRTGSPATRRAQNLPSVLPRILRRKDENPYSPEEGSRAQWLEPVQVWASQEQL